MTNPIPHDQAWFHHILQRATSELRVDSVDALAPLLLGRINRKLESNGFSGELTVADVKSWLDGTAAPENNALREALCSALNFNPTNCMRLEKLYQQIPAEKKKSYEVSGLEAQAAKPAEEAQEPSFTTIRHKRVDPELASYEATLAAWRANKPPEIVWNIPAAKPKQFDARAELEALFEAAAPAETATAQVTTASIERAEPKPTTYAARVGRKTPQPKPTKPEPAAKLVIPQRKDGQTKEKYLKAARIAFDLTPEMVADAIGKSVNSVKNVENGSDNPAASVGMAMAELYQKGQEEIAAAEKKAKVPKDKRTPQIFDIELFNSLPTKFCRTHHAQRQRDYQAAKKEGGAAR
jgi:DNA-binding XRE family transcriptional regulator